ncbi:MAG: hypothetical protein A4E32_01154 [Methanomassiliicoccales archaeon PtaU1.Bin124]|nr:MAG: hypothetical protein A4E32_01154 [Methanomassiliicoccales archaeon PtaU1.Bin124]
MLSYHKKLELTMKKVRMGERWNGTPEECWVARYEEQESVEQQDDQENYDDAEGVA